MGKECIANGLRIHYEEYGQGEPLLLLMGLGAPGRKWAPHIAAYEKHFHVIAPDNRGAGQSDKPVAYSYTIQEMAEDMVALMDELGIEKAHVNGISMGGAIAQHLAVYYPERVKSLILTNTFPWCCTSNRRAIELLRETCGQLDPVTATRLCQWMIFAIPFQNEREDYMLECEYADLNEPYPILDFDIRDRLGEIKAPALVVGGDRDLLIPAWVTREMAGAIPGARLYMAPDGGHVQHWEQLEKYNELTLEFLLENQDRG